MANMLVDDNNYNLQQVRQMNYQDYVEEVIQLIQKKILILSKTAK